MENYFPTLTLGRWTVARLCAIATLFLIPISTAGVNILTPLIVVLMLTCGQFWTSVSELRQNRLVLAASGLFLLLCISLLWDISPLEESMSVLFKYRKLLYLPFLLILFGEPAWRRLAVVALYISLTLVLVFSTTNWLGITHIGERYAPDPIRASWVFKHHITQGLFTALLAYMALTLAWSRHCGERLNVAVSVRVVSAAIALLAFVNLFFMQEGRTGPAVLLPLLLLWIWQTFLREERPRFGSAILVLSVAAVFGGLAVACASQSKTSRMAEVGHEIHEYEKYDKVTSVGLRLEFYRRSLLLISQRPILGWGVGSVGPQFQALASGREGAQGTLSANPHNEYFMMSVQLGVVGLVAFLCLLWQLWRASCKLPGLDGAFSAGYVVAFSIACLANSLLVDFPEGYLLVFLSGILLAPSRVTAQGGVVTADAV